MRPVRRNNSPITGDYKNYKDAKTEIISRIGSYCSYCERKIATNLAIEHIEPKDGKFGQPHLIGKWSNFLLACVNCNSTKGAKQVILSDIFLPDRDNTFFAFKYLADGNIVPNNLTPQNLIKTKATLSLIGLGKKLRQTYDDRGNLIAQDRASQRMEAWGIAESSLDDYLSNQNNQAVKNLILKIMVSSGFFSVWMTVFKNYPEMKNLFIEALPGTRESGCFNPKAEAISPHPNADNLKNGSKI